MNYTPMFFTGDYDDRQRDANGHKVNVYIEQHFNSIDGNALANYSLALVASNAGSLSRQMGTWYAAEVSKRFGIKNNGLKVLDVNERGAFNLRYTNMPALILEPFFVSNKDGAAWAKDPVKQAVLADIINDMVRLFFPNGGLVGLSVGHKGKTSSPKDRGADVLGGGTEADCAEAVLKQTEKLLTSFTVPAHVDKEDEQPEHAIIALSDWQQTASDWAIEAGVTTGERPLDNLTRVELWETLRKFAESTKPKTTK
jgi:N-acetylmuramoyl-L-alanine amidase